MRTVCSCLVAWFYRSRLCIDGRDTDKIRNKKVILTGSQKGYVEIELKVGRLLLMYTLYLYLSRRTKGLRLDSTGHNSGCFQEDLQSSAHRVSRYTAAT